MDDPSRTARPAGAALAPPRLDLEHLRRAVALLRAVAEDRGLLADVPLELRQELLISAGRVSRPESFQEKRLVRAMRRKRRAADEARDRLARDATGIRRAREAAVFVAPAPVPALPEPEDAASELHKPRNCYVCKAEYRRLHFFYDALCPACAAFNYAKRFQSAPLPGRVAVLTGARV